MKCWKTTKPLEARMGASTITLSIEAGVELDEIEAGTESPDDTRVSRKGTLESYIVKVSDLEASAQPC